MRTPQACLLAWRFRIYLRSHNDSTLDGKGLCFYPRRFVRTDAWRSVDSAQSVGRNSSPLPSRQAQAISILPTSSLFASSSEKRPKPEKLARQKGGGQRSFIMSIRHLRNGDRSLGLRYTHKTGSDGARHCQFHRAGKRSSQLAHLQECKEMDVYKVNFQASSRMRKTSWRSRMVGMNKTSTLLSKLHPFGTFELCESVDELKVPNDNNVFVDVGGLVLHDTS